MLLKLVIIVETSYIQSYRFNTSSKEVKQMTDNITPPAIQFWLPSDIWGLIASLLDSNELAQFRQVCQCFNAMGSQTMILQPLYNRLRAINDNLTADLQVAANLAQNTPSAFFKAAFEKIQARQQQEIAYLTKHHTDLMLKPEYAEVLAQNTPVSLKSLEAKNALLDTINSGIIADHININSTWLNLNGIHITRIPADLFQRADKVNFWKNLTHLSCSNNKLSTLNVQQLVALQALACNDNQLIKLNTQGLSALKALDCNNNQLTTLNAQGLVALQQLYCSNNQLTTLNVQGLVALQMLWCWNNQLTILNVQGLAALQMLGYNHNPLTDLNLTGVPPAIKNQHAEIEKNLLFKQLSLSTSIETRQAIIARLGTNYTYKNCFYYSPVYAAKLFITDSLSLFSAYLPSFGASNNTPANPQIKRPHSENQEKEPDDEYKTKRAKKAKLDR